MGKCYWSSVRLFKNGKREEYHRINEVYSSCCSWGKVGVFFFCYTNYFIVVYIQNHISKYILIFNHTYKLYTLILLDISFQSLSFAHVVHGMFHQSWLHFAEFTFLCYLWRQVCQGSCGKVGDKGLYLHTRCTPSPQRSPVSDCHEFLRCLFTFLYV